MPPSPDAPARLIIYACPTGALAAQVDAFYTASRARCGPNSAHAYPPHITLTGFFNDEAGALPIYHAALAAAHTAAMATRPSRPIVITKLLVSAEFHGLLVVSPWLEALTADFADRAASPSRPAALRLKRDLHLSLAYGFRAEDGPALGALACSMVSPEADVAWELRLYEQRPAGEWLCHGVWPLG
jgi:hypothetical protein